MVVMNPTQNMLKTLHKLKFFVERNVAVFNGFKIKIVPWNWVVQDKSIIHAARKANLSWQKFSTFVTKKSPRDLAMQWIVSCNPREQFLLDIHCGEGVPASQPACLLFSPGWESTSRHYSRLKRTLSIAMQPMHCKSRGRCQHFYGIRP